MATPSTQPRIAHGIARLHPDQGLESSHWQWGPEWTLPPARTGRWVIDRIFDVAIRVEFDAAVPLHQFDHLVWNILEAARDALAPDQEAHLNEWLESADRREAAAFARKWTARQRREHGDIPSLAAGTYIRDPWRSSGVWHIANGQTTDHWRLTDRVVVGTYCHQNVTVDLGDAHHDDVATTTEPTAVCKRCLPRTAEPRRLVAVTA